MWQQDVVSWFLVLWALPKQSCAGPSSHEKQALFWVPVVFLLTSAVRRVNNDLLTSSFLLFPHLFLCNIYQSGQFPVVPSPWYWEQLLQWVLLTEQFQSSSFSSSAFLLKESSLPFSLVCALSSWTPAPREMEPRRGAAVREIRRITHRFDLNYLESLAKALLMWKKPVFTVWAQNWCNWTVGFK